MIDCIPDFSGTTCVNCGWIKPVKIKGWPHRNCPQSPDLQPAADMLGVSLADVGHYVHALARWTAAGFPQPLPGRRAICESNECGEYASLEDRCQCSTCSGHGKRLTIEGVNGPVDLRQIATLHCPRGKWPGDPTIESADPATSARGDP